jgi:hypothetical protein
VPPLNVTPSISHLVTGMKTTAAIRPDTARPWYRARSTLPDFDFTANVPMIDAMIETPPRMSGYSATDEVWVKVSTPSSITATAVTA